MSEGAFPGIHTRKGGTLPTGHSHTLPVLVSAQKIHPGSKVGKISSARGDRRKGGAVLTQIHVQNSALEREMPFFSQWIILGAQEVMDPGGADTNPIHHSHAPTSSYTCPAIQSPQPPLSQEILRVIELYFITINSFFLCRAKPTHSSQPGSFI